MYFFVLTTTKYRMYLKIVQLVVLLVILHKTVSQTCPRCFKQVCVPAKDGEEDEERQNGDEGGRGEGVGGGGEGGGGGGDGGAGNGMKKKKKQDAIRNLFPGLFQPLPTGCRITQDVLKTVNARNAKRLFRNVECPGTKQPCDVGRPGGSVCCPTCVTDVILTQVVNPMRPDIPLYPVQLDGSYQIFSEGICADKKCEYGKCQNEVKTVPVLVSTTDTYDPEDVYFEIIEIMDFCHCVNVGSE